MALSTYFYMDNIFLYVIGYIFSALISSYFWWSYRYVFSIHSFQANTGKSFKAIARFDTDVELTYFNNGGILNYMIRKMIGC